MSSVVVTPTVDVTNSPPRVRLDISDTVNPLAISTTVMRNNPDGSQSPVRTADGNPQTLTVSGASTVGLLYDYEMPYGQGVSYTTVESPGNVTATVTVDPGGAWFVHPGVPALSMPITVRPGSFVKRSQPIKQGIFYVMGRATPVVQSDGARKSVASSVTVLARNADDRNGLDALLSDAGVLLLNIPPSRGWNFGTCYIAPAQADISVLVDRVVEQWMDYTIPFVVVDMPAGGNSAQRSYADLIANYSTYSQEQAAYSSYTALLAGP